MRFATTVFRNGVLRLWSSRRAMAVALLLLILMLGALLELSLSYSHVQAEEATTKNTVDSADRVDSGARQSGVPTWIPILVGILGLFGTVAGAAVGQIVATRSADTRQRELLEREDKREQMRLEREAENRKHEQLREERIRAYTNFLQVTAGGRPLQNEWDMLPLLKAYAQVRLVAGSEAIRERARNLYLKVVNMISIVRQVHDEKGEDFAGDERVLHASFDADTAWDEFMEAAEVDIGIEDPTGRSSISDIR